MSKIVEFDAARRDITKKFDELKNILAKTDPEKISQFIIYIKTGEHKKDVKCWAYNPDWEMTGQVQMFIEEIKLELYAEDFLDSDDDTELN